jgi:hypothetical protein
VEALELAFGILVLETPDDDFGMALGFEVVSDLLGLAMLVEGSALEAGMVDEQMLGSAKGVQREE